MKAKSKSSGFLSRVLHSTPEQARDTGLAMVLICLLWAYWGGRPGLLPWAMALLVLTMVWPRAFQPLAGVWFGLSRLLGHVVSTVILTVVFFLVVTPMGLVRRLLGADALQLKKWKQGRGSVFTVREGATQPQDLAHPY